MASNAFQARLWDFCQKYLFANIPISDADKVAFPQQLAAQRHALFEQLLLFDTVAFKVKGENVPLALLINECGLKSVEQLIEEDALKFVQWKQDLVFMVTDQPGVNPLAAGSFQSGPLDDPEQSVALGLNWLRQSLPESRKRRLITKVADRYVAQPEGVAHDAVALAHEAFNSGRLKTFGLSPDDHPLDNMPKEKRQQLAAAGGEVLEYKLLLSNNWTSCSEYAYFEIFSESVRRIASASSTTSGFYHLAELAQVPDLPALFNQIQNPLRSVAKFRSRSSSSKFRKWLAEGGDEDVTDLTRRYVDSIAESQGFFQRTSGKFVKSFAMTAIGVGLSQAIEVGAESAAWGALAGKAAETLGELGLDMLDATLLDSVLKGWTPRVFFNDLKKVVAQPPAQ